MSELFIDIETYNETPITAGTYRYAETAEVMLIGWAIDDGEPQVWDGTADEQVPVALARAICDDTVLLVAHNSQFDRTVLGLQMPGMCPPLARWRDSMVKAMAHGLPGGLDKIGQILNLAEDAKKHKDGKELIQLFCKPRPKNSALRRATSATHPEEWARFKAYTSNDIVAMRAIYRKLPSWNYQANEIALWHLDQTINGRGIQVDLDFANAAITAVNKEKAVLAERTAELTEGAVASTTQRDVLLAHLLSEHDVALPDLQSSTLERRITDPDLPWAVRELLAVRLQASMTGATKYAALVKAVSRDGRLRGTLQFDGAARTRRWSGRLFQPQNLFRPPKHISEQWEAVIQAIQVGAIDLINANVMEACAATVRGALVAASGRKLVVADLSNIEGRDQAWLAGEQWKLRAFRDFDAGTGHDMYKLAYAKSFGVKPEDVTKDQRQVGKVQELALGYAGGVGAFLAFSLVYGIDLEAMAEEAERHIPPDVWAESLGFYDWTVRKKRGTFKLSQRGFVVCESFKRLWRMAHPEIVATWGELDQAVKSAIGQPGVTFSCRKFKTRRDGSWLRIGLPSGRCLCYPSPQVNDHGEISYMGVNQYTRKWGRIKSFGGKFFENACQGVARDVMADNMLAIENAGYPIVLTVHDEVVTETPDSEKFTAGGLASLLAANNSWTQGLPLAAAGFEAYRYRKD